MVPYVQLVADNRSYLIANQTGFLINNPTSKISLNSIISGLGSSDGIVVNLDDFSWDKTNTYNSLSGISW